MEEKNRRKRKRVPFRTKDSPYENDEALTTHLTRIGMIRSDWTIHDQRCEADPIYRLLFFGNAPLEMDDGTVHRYIDYLMVQLMDMLEDMYQDAFRCARRIQHIMPLLTNTKDVDIAPRIMLILAILHRIPRLAQSIANLYDTSSDYDLFSNGGDNHFFAFLKYVYYVLEHHLNHAYNKYTIKREVSGFFHHMQREYMMGPPPIKDVTDVSGYS